MRLYILEDLPSAKAVAKAFGSEIKGSSTNTAQITAGGVPSLLYWHDRMRILGSDKKPSISEKAEKVLTGIFSENGITEIVIALFPTRTSCLFADCVRRQVQDSGISVYIALLATLKKADILYAMENARKATPDSLDVIRATSERHNAYTATNAIRQLLKGDDKATRFDLNLLTALCFVAKRAADERKKKYRIRTEVEIGGAATSLWSAEEYTKEEAEGIVRELGKKLTALPVDMPDLPTVISLYGVYKKLEPREIQLRDAAVSLYEKRYISNPFTLSGSLPVNTTSNLKGEVISACRALYPGEERLDTDALSYFDVLSSIAPSAILPLKNSTASLSESETALYSVIVSAAVDAICREDKYTLQLLDKKTGVLFTAPLPEGMPRGTRSYSPGPLTLQETGTFSCYSIMELVEQLVHSGHESSDVLMTLIDRLTKTQAVYVDNVGVHMTDKGGQIIRQLPVPPEDVIALFKIVNAPADNPADINSHLVRVSNEVNRTVAAWLSMKENGEKKQAPETKPEPAEKEPAPQRPEKAVDAPVPLAPQPVQQPAPPAPKPAPADPSMLPCPFCGNQAVTEEEHTFFCRSCGNSIGKLLRIGDALYNITEKDIRSLAKNRRTKLKLGKNALNEIVTGGYIILDSTSFELSHRSNILCPYCGKHLEAYAWGFKCSSCAFGVPFEVYHVRLKNSDIQHLLAGEKTDVIRDLISPHGEYFSAKLLAQPDGKIRPYRVREEE